MNMKSPTLKTVVRGFIGLINHYQEMWEKRSYMLQPLTRLVPKKEICKWTDVE